MRPLLFNARHVVAACATPLVLAGLAASSACGDDDGARVLAATIEAPATAPGGGEVAVVIRVRDDADRPAADEPLTIAIEGGGTAPATVTTDDAGEARLTWTLGPMPIAQQLHVDGARDDLMRPTVSADATVVAGTATGIASAPFGEVEDFLADKGTTGSTEDLAFSPDGKLVLAHGGADAGLFAVASDGSVSAIATTGEPFDNPLGLSYAADGTLYIADGGRDALLALKDGVVTKVADKDGDEAFTSPNDVAAGDGVVFMSDSCTAKLYAIDPTNGAVLARVALDPLTEGGANGIAIAADGAVWLTTENTAIFCGAAVELTAPLGSLYRIPYADGAFGPKEAIATGVGVFGDGLAFDADQNLYVIFDTTSGLALDESIVFVRRAGADDTLVRAFAARGKVYANLVFGRGAFGATTMYLAMLQVALVPGSPRGAERIEVGVTAE